MSAWQDIADVFAKAHRAKARGQALEGMPYWRRLRKSLAPLSFQANRKRARLWRCKNSGAAKSFRINE
jgi:hypothetical protein